MKENMFSKQLYDTTPVDTDNCVNNIGNRFDLILVASARVRELRKGHKKFVSSLNSLSVTALKEIEQGHVTKDYLKKVR